MNLILDYVKEERPLSQKELSFFKINRTSLICIIDPTGLTDHMEAKKVITWQHREFIESFATKRDKTWHILDILIRRSYKAVVNFARCLEETNQFHVSKIFHDGGGRHQARTRWNKNLCAISAELHIFTFCNVINISTLSARQALWHGIGSHVRYPIKLI